MSDLPPLQEKPGRFGLRDLLCEQSRDLYDASLRFRDELEELRDAAISSDLTTFADEMLSEYSGSAEDLAKACSLLGVPPGGVVCEAMKGLVRECKDSTREWDESATRDAAIIANAQRVAHYAIAGYGTAASFARCLKLTEVEVVYKRLLQGAVAMDARLSKLATGGWLSPGINQEAAR